MNALFKSTVPQIKLSIAAPASLNHLRFYELHAHGFSLAWAAFTVQQRKCKLLFNFKRLWLHDPKRIQQHCNSSYYWTVWEALSPASAMEKKATQTMVVGVQTRTQKCKQNFNQSASRTHYDQKLELLQKSRDHSNMFKHVNGGSGCKNRVNSR